MLQYSPELLYQEVLSSSTWNFHPSSLGAQDREGRYPLEAELICRGGVEAVLRRDADLIFRDKVSVSQGLSGDV